jgi:putative oxidoreductase
MAGVATLILRLTVGGLLAGHGAQKLFGWFGGSGAKGTAKAMESMGLAPGTLWAPVAGLAELGVLTVALAIALAGPGRYSLDAALRLRLPASLVAAAVVLAAAGVTTGSAAPALLAGDPARQEDAV